MRQVPALGTSLALALALALAGPAPAVWAGSLVITGHDDDHHAGGAPAREQIRAMAALARAGAPHPALPVLVFDHGAELQNALRALGIPFQNEDPAAGVPAAGLLDVTRFSAIAVASDAGCSGCDNDRASSANLAAARHDIAAFFNRGGGIFAFTAGGNPGYYAFLPAAAIATGSPAPQGYAQTTEGSRLGISPVNGNPTHNLFPEPGTGGVDAHFRVVERYSGPDAESHQMVHDVPVTLAITDARIGSTGFTRRNWLEALMDTTTLVAAFGLLAFMVERLTNGIALVAGYWSWWRARMEVVDAADPVAHARIDRNRRVGLFALSAVLGIAGAFLLRLNFLSRIGLVVLPASAGAAASGTSVPDAVGYLATGLLIAAGADPIRELLKLGDRPREAPAPPPPPPVHLTGTLILQQAPPAAGARREGEPPGPPVRP